jgi:hypothetical protein
VEAAQAADGTGTPGLVRNNRWYLRNTLTNGVAELVVGYGFEPSVPMAGDWDGDGTDGMAVVVTTDPAAGGTRWYLRDDLTAGPGERRRRLGAAGLAA